MHKYFFILFYFFAVQHLLAQNEPADTLDLVPVVPVVTDTSNLIVTQNGVPVNKDTIDIINTEALSKRYSPRKALFYAAVLPGLGQIYNNSYWKLPLLYGTATALIFGYNWNRGREIRFKNALLASKDRDPTTINPFIARIGRDDPAVLQRNLDASRRNKEYMLILTSLLYLVNIVDAHVDAHLKGFDIADDIALKIEPSFESAALGSPVAGIAFTIRFR